MRRIAPTKSRSRRWRAASPVALLLVALVTASCHDAPLAGPELPGPEFASTSGEPDLLRPASDAPPLLTREVSFVATKGKSHRVELYYEDPEEPGSRGERFLRFELDDESLLRYPENHPMEGALFQAGDTVTISIRASEDTLLARFEPSGLTFDADEPARLRLNYLHADLDPDRESDVDIWKQEEAGDPWSDQDAGQDEDSDSCWSEVTSFTRYGMAI